MVVDRVFITNVYITHTHTHCLGTCLPTHCSDLYSCNAVHACVDWGSLRVPYRRVYICCWSGRCGCREQHPSTAPWCADNGTYLLELGLFLSSHLITLSLYHVSQCCVVITLVYLLSGTVTIDRCDSCTAVPKYVSGRAAGAWSVRGKCVKRGAGSSSLCTTFDLHVHHTPHTIQSQSCTEYVHSYRSQPPCCP